MRAGAQRLQVQLSESARNLSESAERLTERLTEGEEASVRLSVRLSETLSETLASLTEGSPPLSERDARAH